VSAGAASDPAAAPAAGAPGANGGPAGLPARPVRLLVVDDDAVDRLAVRRALRQAGIEAEVVEAEDGEAALAAMRAALGGAGAPLDCVLLDYQLPGASGLEVLQRLRAEPHDGGAAGSARCRW
jgi:CheY-like chemotaxis protein